MQNDQLNINLGSDRIEQTESLSYLGLEIDSRYKFNVYITKLIKKINKSIGILKPRTGYLPTRCK